MAKRTTGVVLESADMELLQKVAVVRALQTGKRISVSDVIRSLIETNRESLLEEAGKVALEREGEKGGGG